MPFKSISRHQPSQQEPKLSWPSLTGKCLKNCRYHQNKTPQQSLLPKQQQSSNPRQQKAPRPLDAVSTGSHFRPFGRGHQRLQPAVHITQSMLPLWPKTLYGPASSEKSYSINLLKPPLQKLKPWINQVKKKLIQRKINLVNPLQFSHTILVMLI